MAHNKSGRAKTARRLRKQVRALRAQQAAPCWVAATLAGRSPASPATGTSAGATFVQTDRWMPVQLAVSVLVAVVLVVMLVAMLSGAFNGTPATATAPTGTAAPTATPMAPPAGGRDHEVPATPATAVLARAPFGAEPVAASQATYVVAPLRGYATLSHLVLDRCTWSLPYGDQTVALWRPGGLVAQVLAFNGWTESDARHLSWADFVALPTSICR